MLELKHHITVYCQHYLQQKVMSLQIALKDVTEAGNNETKSTAGDKHETGRAMMQLEQEKLGKQLYELEQQLQEFNKINFTISSPAISLGSLVETNNGLFLMATSIGKIEIDQKFIFIISTQSPLAIALASKKQNDSISFNSTNYKILGIY